MKYLERLEYVPAPPSSSKTSTPVSRTITKATRKRPRDAQYQQRLRELQELFYAEGLRSLLICLQADAGGKDGTISHILGAMNPQGCKVVAFKQPSTEELAHDFLWRVHRAAPAFGEVAIFNRSHYEDVLIARVHELVPKERWSRRYDRINAFESGLVEEDTHILKFYLHISKGEQLKRFKDRLDDPAKQWKISEADYKAAPTGTTTRRPTRMHSPVAAPSTPLGLSSPRTTSGSGTLPWPGSSWSTWKG